MKTAIQIVLFAVIIGLSYLVYDSIMEPIRFDRNVEARRDAAKKRLIDIRNAQVAYKSLYGKYTGSFDTLVSFLKSDSLKMVKAIGTVPDSFYLKYPRKDAEKKALELGIISRDTLKVSVFDSLCAKKYAPDSIKFIPYLRKGEQFELKTANLETGSKIKVWVFEAKVHNDVFLSGLNKQMVINLNDDAEKMNRFAGLKVGSTTEVTNNDGNW